MIKLRRLDSRMNLENYVGIGGPETFGFIVGPMDKSKTINQKRNNSFMSRIHPKEAIAYCLGSDQLELGDNGYDTCWTSVQYYRKREK